MPIEGRSDLFLNGAKRADAQLEAGSKFTVMPWYRFCGKCGIRDQRPVTQAQAHQDWICRTCRGNSR